MRLEQGMKSKRIQLPAIDGSEFDSMSLEGKPYLLSFYRFATCPFCNMRIHELTKRMDEFGDDFTVVAIFESPLEHLHKHTKDHEAIFPILSDVENKFYKQYGIEHSLWGMLKGMITRMPVLLKGMLNGHVPYVIKGDITKMPADFLIDEEGVIQKVYYGEDDGDHLPFEEIKAFALAAKRDLSLA